MVQLLTASRDSRTADRQGPASASPFRSSLPRKRVLAAEAMIAKRLAEIEELEELLDGIGELDEQKRVTLRLTATYRNLAAWQNYLVDGSPKEIRAVIVP